MKTQNIVWLSESEKQLLINGGIVKIASTVVLALLKRVLENGACRPVEGTGSGKWSSTKDNTDNVTHLLKLLGYGYTITNDAPRGGKQGTLLKLTAKGLTDTLHHVTRVVKERELAEKKVQDEKDAKDAATRAFHAQVNLEANKIVIDESYIKACDGIRAKNLTGKIKSLCYETAFEALLQRNNMVLENDFWAVFRAVKHRIDSETK